MTDLQLCGNATKSDSDSTRGVRCLVHDNAGIQILLLGQEHAEPLLQHRPEFSVQPLVVEERGEGGQHLLVHNLAERGVDAVANLVHASGVEIVDYSAEKVQKGGRDGGMGSHAVMHHEDGGLNVHDVVLLRVEEEPVVEERQFSVAGSHRVSACC